MTELLLYVSTSLGLEPLAADKAGGAPKPAFGLALSPEELLDMRIARDAFVAKAGPALTGVDATGAPAPSPHHESLVAAGRRWALHILEGPWAWALAALYIFVTVTGCACPFCSVGWRGGGRGACGVPPLVGPATRDDTPHPCSRSLCFLRPRRGWPVVMVRCCLRHVLGQRGPAPGKPCRHGCRPASAPLVPTPLPAASKRALLSSSFFCLARSLWTPSRTPRAPATPPRWR